MTEVKSLYIHIPFCISKCKYCDFFSVPCRKTDASGCTKDETDHNDLIPDTYICSICNEIIYRFNYFNVHELETIYIGGGTPSLLSKKQLIKIFDAIKTTKLSSNCEITIEANPDDITEDLINSWASLGINRISLGIQSFNDEALSYVGRRASATVNRKGLQIVREHWKGQISVDLICGLPHQNAESFKNDLTYLLSFKPDHISMYSLVIEDETPLGKEYNSGNLNYDFDFADELWLYSKEFLKNNGYIHYEVSNFCLPKHECKHNLKYWNHESYIGVGSGGAGTVYNDDGSGRRWTNIKNIKNYINFWTNKNHIKLNDDNFVQWENIDCETSKFEFFMMGMRKLEGIKSVDYKKIFGEEIPDNFIKVLDKWAEKGLCIVDDDKLYPMEKTYSLGHKGIIYLNKFLQEII